MDFLLWLIPVVLAIAALPWLKRPIERLAVKVIVKLKTFLRTGRIGGIVVDNQPLELVLLTYVWDYPTTGGVNAAWAVKESKVIMGELDTARKRPGYGATIVSTDLALRAFGPHAIPRIELAVNYISSQLDDDKPPMVTVAPVDERSTRQLKPVPDLRHTMAYAVVLARSEMNLDYVGQILNLVLTLQGDDGGWPVGEGDTTSDFFSAMYAVELIVLCLPLCAHLGQPRERLQTALERGLHWFDDKCDDKSLWATGVFDDKPWDGVLASGWGVYRFAPLTANLAGNWWTDRLARVVMAVYKHVNKPETWESGAVWQKFRIKARAGAGVRAALDTLEFGKFDRRRLEHYLDIWKREALSSMKDLPLEKWDVTTCALLLDTFVSATELKDWGRQVLHIDKSDSGSMQPPVDVGNRS